MRVKSQRIAYSIAIVFAASELCQGQGSRVPRFPAGSPIEELAAQFRVGHAPSADSLIGNWTVERHVTTEKFITGRVGPDRVFHESASLVFRRDGDRQLQVRYSAVRRWTTPRRNADGDIVFDSDDAGDVETFWSCRLSTTSHLVCFDLAHIGSGAADAIEFVRQGGSGGPSNISLELTRVLAPVP